MAWYFGNTTTPLTITVNRLDINQNNFHLSVYLIPNIQITAALPAANQNNLFATAPNDLTNYNFIKINQVRLQTNSYLSVENNNTIIQYLKNVNLPIAIFTFGIGFHNNALPAPVSIFDNNETIVYPLTISQDDSIINYDCSIDYYISSNPFLNIICRIQNSFVLGYDYTAIYNKIIADLGCANLQNIICRTKINITGKIY